MCDREWFGKNGVNGRYVVCCGLFFGKESKLGLDKGIFCCKLFLIYVNLLI